MAALNVPPMVAIVLNVGEGGEDVMRLVATIQANGMRFIPNAAVKITNFRIIAKYRYKKYKNID